MGGKRRSTQLERIGLVDLPIRRQSWPGQKSILVREVIYSTSKRSPLGCPYRVLKSPFLLPFLYLTLELHTAPGTPHSQQKIIEVSSRTSNRDMKREERGNQMGQENYRRRGKGQELRHKRLEHFTHGSRCSEAATCLKTARATTPWQ
jgi:hypothetical protein